MLSTKIQTIATTGKRMKPQPSKILGNAKALNNSLISDHSVIRYIANTELAAQLMVLQ